MGTLCISNIVMLHLPFVLIDALNFTVSLPARLRRFTSKRNYLMLMLLQMGIWVFFGGGCYAVGTHWKDMPCLPSHKRFHSYVQTMHYRSLSNNKFMRQVNPRLHAQLKNDSVQEHTVDPHQVQQRMVSDTRVIKLQIFRIGTMLLLVFQQRNFNSPC